jgi:hypothetical protein
MSSLPFSLQRLFEHVTQRGEPQRHSLVNRLLAASLGCTELPGRADFARLRPALRWAILSLASCVGLTLTITVAAVVSVGMSTPAFQMFGLRASAASGAETRAERSFESILQRPLFSRSRQAATVAVSTPPTPVATRSRNIILKGVFINGVSSKVFLTSEENPLGIWVESNEEIAGWRVITVKPDQVVLRAQSDELVIALVSTGGSSSASEMPSLAHRGGRLEPPRAPQPRGFGQAISSRTDPMTAKSTPAPGLQSSVR